MSFLSELRRGRRRLRAAETLVTRADGRQFVEAGGAVRAVGGGARGYVVDTAPDRTPARVVAGLYVGSQDCAAPDVLAQYGIRHVLSLGVRVDVPVSSLFVECLDVPETDVRAVLRAALPWVRAAVRAGGRVLLHCNAGVSRAPAAAVGYLQQYEGLRYAEAYAAVKAARPAAQPNEGFRRQLMMLPPGGVL